MTPNRPVVLEVRDVDIRYGANLVVSGASFNAYDGEFVTLLGPSGSGKTSLLRTIAGFVPVAAGQLKLHGVPVEKVPPYQRDVGLVFQNYALFPHMTVEQNLSFGPRMMKVRKDAVEEAVSEALSHVRLERFRARYPHELSGGQQQRVAIARALALRPSLLLLDEPMSNLDARLRAEMRVELVELLKRLHVTAVAVTHNQEEALGMSDRIVVMAEGEVRQVGSPVEIYGHPADAFVAQFVGDANILEASFSGSSPAGDSTFRMPTGGSIHVTGEAERLRHSTHFLIRPEAIRLSPIKDTTNVAAANAMVVDVVSQAFMGSTLEVRLMSGRQPLLVKVPASEQWSWVTAGSRALVQWDANTVKPLESRATHG